MGLIWGLGPSGKLTDTLGMFVIFYVLPNHLTMCIVVELPGNVFVGGEGSLATNVPRTCALRDRHFTVPAAFFGVFFLNCV